MRGGRRIAASATLQHARERCQRELELLPEPLRVLDPAPAYPVRVSDGLRQLALEVDRRQAAALG